jgi:hypothetical protein
MAQQLTAREILEELDHDARTEPAFFPDFDEGGSYHIDARLTAYGDGARWALVIEQLAVNPRDAGNIGGVATTLFYHGNCIQLPPQPGWDGYDVQTVFVIGDGPSAPLIHPPHSEQVNPAATDIRIRGQAVPICTDSNYYWARRIEVEVLTHEQINEWIEQVRRGLPRDDAEEKVRYFEREVRPRVGKFELRICHLLRGLVPEYREPLLSTDAERRRGLPKGLPQLVQLNDWDHPRLLDGELPSGSKSFRGVASVLAGADPRTVEWPAQGNVHWSHWPDSGSL